RVRLGEQVVDEGRTGRRTEAQGILPEVEQPHIGNHTDSPSRADAATDVHTEAMATFTWPRGERQTGVEPEGGQIRRRDPQRYRTRCAHARKVAQAARCEQWHTSSGSDPAVDRDHLDAFGVKSSSTRGESRGDPLERKRGPAQVVPCAGEIK